MTIKELENWLTENKLKDIVVGYIHEYYYKNNLFIIYTKNYAGKYELKTFTLKYHNDRNIILSYPCMCKELEKFDMEDLEYYFEEFKKKQEFLNIYTKQKFIERKKNELMKDFS